MDNLVPELRIEGLRVTHGRHETLRGVDLKCDIAGVQVVCGAPRCGKSTLARALCGFERVSGGSVFIRGSDVTGLAPAKRRIGYVPQSFALFPQYSVGENIAYPLKLQRVAVAERRRRVRDIAEMLRIEAFVDQRVDKVSGGQKQRVAIARGLIRECALYVLDDPLAGLDFKLRESLVFDLHRMQKQRGATFVYMTSDPLEPLFVGDDVAVLDRGVVVERGPADALYARAQSLASVEALGFPSANRLDGMLRYRRGVIESNSLCVGVGDGVSIDGDVAVTLVVRPESLTLDPNPAAVPIRGNVDFVEDLGSDVVSYFRSEGVQWVMCHPKDRRLVPKVNSSVIVYVPLAKMSVYSKQDGRKIDVRLQVRPE